MHIEECTPTICANTDGTVGDGKRGHGYEFEDEGVPVAQSRYLSTQRLKRRPPRGPSCNQRPELTRAPWRQNGFRDKIRSLRPAARRGLPPAQATPTNLEFLVKREHWKTLARTGTIPAHSEKFKPSTQGRERNGPTFKLPTAGPCLRLFVEHTLSQRRPASLKSATHNVAIVYALSRS